MRLKLDENLSRHLKPQLIALGHDTLTVADEGLLSRPDTEIAAAAITEDRMLLTLDLDFANILRYPPGSHSGIVLFRPRSMGPLTVNRIISDFVQRHDLDALKGCLAIVEADRIRVRRPEEPV